MYARTAPGDEPRDFQHIGRARCVGRLLADSGKDPIEHGGHDDIDAFDHHYRIELAPREVAPGSCVTLRLPIVATVATLRWNDEVIHTATSSFVPVVVDLTDRIGSGGTLSVSCHSLTHWLGASKRTRPRFRSRLVADQRLRFARASLLGRIPAWSPPVPVVGISGAIELCVDTVARIDELTLTPTVGDCGEGLLAVRLEVSSRRTLRTARVECGGVSIELAAEVAATSAGATVFTGILSIPDVRLWWPHTHGEPVLYDVSCLIQASDGESENRSLGRTGFRSLTIDRSNDGEGFAIDVNGVAIFCRGSAWMPIDPRDPSVDPAQLHEALTMCRERGMNMIRLTGVTGWEQPEFYNLCAELGILVWQDLPLATLDQPTDDTFTRALTIEIQSSLSMLSGCPAVVVLCGASERQQQAAMLGLDADIVMDAVGSAILGSEMAARRLDIAFVPCSPSGGHLPFIADRGVSHYYGVGAYLRPLTDLRHANVRFTSECLAFSNVPEPTTIDHLLADGESAPTHPRWKQRVPRDRGVGWDFEDVRDHYFRIVTGEDPFAVRMRDVGRYLELSRVTSAVVMTTAFQEWRRPTSSCAGALTWFLRDLWRGAGWGLMDSDGRAKAAFDALADTWSPISIGLIDEGVNGVDLWVHNDRPEPITGTVEITRVRHAKAVVRHRTDVLAVRAHQSLHLRVDELLARFTDPSDAYRFGPRQHDGLTARLLDENGATVARHVLDTSGGHTLHQTAPEWHATASRIDDARVAVELSAVDLVRDVRFEDAVFTPERHHVDVVPGEHRRFVLRHTASSPSSVTLGAVNSRTTLRVPIEDRPPGGSYVRG